MLNYHARMAGESINNPAARPPIGVLVLYRFKLRDHKNSHTKLTDPQLMKENKVKRP